MNRIVRAAVFAVAFLALFWLGAAAAVAYGVGWARSLPAVEVRVDDRASAVLVDARVPAVLVAGALVAIPRLAHGDPWAGLGDDPDVRRWGPVAAEVLRQLEDAPDAVLVEVDDGHERVRVEKRRGSLRVSVRSPEADVDLSVPDPLLRHFAAALDDALR
jgi:hypothetical protein